MCIREPVAVLHQWPIHSANLIVCRGVLIVGKTEYRFYESGGLVRLTGTLERHVNTRCVIVTPLNCAVLTPEKRDSDKMGSRPVPYKRQCQLLKNCFLITSRFDHFPWRPSRVIKSCVCVIYFCGIISHQKFNST